MFRLIILVTVANILNSSVHGKINLLHRYNGTFYKGKESLNRNTMSKYLSNRKCSVVKIMEVVKRPNCLDKNVEINICYGSCTSTALLNQPVASCEAAMYTEKGFIMFCTDGFHAEEKTENYKMKYFAIKYPIECKCTTSLD